MNYRKCNSYENLLLYLIQFWCFNSSCRGLGLLNDFPLILVLITRSSNRLSIGSSLPSFILLLFSWFFFLYCFIIFPFFFFFIYILLWILYFSSFFLFRAFVNLFLQKKKLLSLISSGFWNDLRSSRTEDLLSLLE